MTRAQAKRKLQEARDYYERIKRADRPMTEAQRRRFDELISAADSLSEERKMKWEKRWNEGGREMGRDEQGGVFELRHGGDPDIPSDWHGVPKAGRTQDTAGDSKVYGVADYSGRSGDGAELVALRTSDSCAEYLAERRTRQDWRSPNTDISLGQFCRAVVTGPKSEAEHRAMQEATDTSGGFAVPEMLMGELIDKARAQSVAFRAGATLVPLESNDVGVAKWLTDPEAAWIAEGDTVTESTPTIGMLKFKTHTLTALAKASVQLLEDNTVNLEAALIGSLVSSLALKLDLGILTGTGGSNTDPVSGITSDAWAVDTTDVSSTLDDYDHFLDARSSILAANRPEPTGAVLHPLVEGGLTKMRDGSGSYYPAPQGVPQRFTTSQLTSPGTTDGTGSKVLIGFWPDCLIGIRTSARVLPLRERYMSELEVGFLAYLRADMVLAHDASFHVLDDVLVT